jgi:hypothetical protein
VHLNKSNKWDAAGDVLLVSKRVEALSQLYRTPRTYKKRKGEYWECELKEKRGKHKHKMEADKQTQIHENVDSNHTADIENMTPKGLREGLKKFGIKTRVRDVKRLQEMFEDALRNSHEAL